MSHIKPPKDTVVCGISEFVNALCDIRCQYRTRNEYTGEKFSLFYRGQADVAWELIPGLFRKVFPMLDYHEDNRFPPLENAKAKLMSDLLKEESETSDRSYFYREVEIVKSIQNRYPRLIPPDMDALDVLTVLQHYGAKTRLLDITPNSLVALFFAIDKVVDDNGAAKDGVVYVFPIPEESENESLSSRDTLCALSDPKLYCAGTVKNACKKGRWNIKVKDFYPKLVSPRFLSDRQIAQSGYFFLFPNFHELNYNGYY